VNGLFDPTAFENMRVVIDGFFYDKDLDGEIQIIDRNDFVNIAKLSREYSIQLRMTASRKKWNATYFLKAGLDNLASELLQLSAKKVGCIVGLEFMVRHPNEKGYFDKIQSYLKDYWGDNRTIHQLVQLDPLSDHTGDIENKITIQFNRLVSEDQIDDLLAIGDHMLDTLIWLENHIK
jgi:hypothetical protein